jgi:transglutaminase/protease-like cytokinesis protein 3
MNRLLITFFIITASINLTSAQTEKVDSLKGLALKLTTGLISDRQKVDAIFYWVTDNIEYDYEALNNSKPYPEFDIKPTFDTVEYHRLYNESVANIVLQRKKGICDGYSRLFKSLCNHAGIQCEVVNGKTKDPLNNDLMGHAWNAVKIENKWHLVDPTWASGHGIDTFNKERDLFYYLTPPEILFLNHYPNDQRWTLMDKSYNLEKFRQSPIEDIRVIKNGLKDFYPKSKTITIQKGQLITVWLEFDKSANSFPINVTEYGQESKASKLDIRYTDNTYDSLLKIDPDFFSTIKKIEVTRKLISQNKIEFIIKPLTDIKGFSIHVDGGLPALDYNIIYKK